MFIFMANTIYTIFSISLMMLTKLITRGGELITADSGKRVLELSLSIETHWVLYSFIMSALCQFIQVYFQRHN